MAIIEVNHVIKEFQLGQLQSIKLGLQRTLARMSGHPLPARVSFKALDNVDFQIEPGEVVGIIGHNGAGKSTLLKILSRITVPTSGTVTVRGRVAPLIEVGAGLIGDLTGRENIYLNGAILGMPRAEIRKKLDSIVAFAEFEDFVDTPVKRYSSGMQVRLAFSIATSVEADILIVDEVLAVGDLAFQRKCFDRMEEMIKRQKKTVLLVSHNIRQVERLCKRVMLLDHGHVVIDGPPQETCNMFYEQTDAKIKRTSQEAARRMRGVQKTDAIDLVNVSILDASGTPTSDVTYGDDLTVVLRWEARIKLIRPTFAVGVHTTDFVYLATNHSVGSLRIAEMLPGIHETRCLIKHFPFLPGIYALRVGMEAGEPSAPLYYAENVLFFQVIPRDHIRSRDMHDAVIKCEATWSLSRPEERATRSEVFGAPA